MNNHHRFANFLIEALPLTESLCNAASVVELSIPSTDGYPLAALSYRPIRDPSALVLINSAVGVKQSYYRRFAGFLVDEGFEVLTYDYRGIGRSAPPRLRGFHARMRDWGQKDFPAVLDWCVAHSPARPIFVVGHSVGGQILGLAPNNSRVAGFVGVCAQYTWWRYWPLHRQPGLILLWYVVIPALSHTLGYFPSSRVRFGEDLPKGVALEWAQWACSKEHVVSAIGEHVRPGYSDYKGAILGYSFEDDAFAPPNTVERLLAAFCSADRTHRHVRPADVGRPIGHFGYFREEFRDTLWRDTADWLKSRLHATRL